MPTIDRAAANDKLGRQVKLKDQLREQNKKLKAENEKLKVKLSNTMMDTGRLAETIWEKDEEIKKLKKEVSDNELEIREYQERVLGEYGEDAEALEPQYHRFCEWCKETRLGINEHIFIYEKDGVDSKTLCQECGEPNPYHTSPYSQLKKEGYTCDEDE